MKFTIKRYILYFMLINIVFSFSIIKSFSLNMKNLNKLKKIKKVLNTNKNNIRLKITSVSRDVKFNSKTNPNDWGNNSIFYLDRHNVDCGPRQIMQGFHLFRPKENQIAYEYACLNSSSVLTPYYSDQTPWNETSNNERGSTNYLDRHNVKCKNGYGLQQFKLIRNGRKIAYAYRCAQIKYKNCKTEKTQETWGNNIFETIYLDRQRLDVGKGQALTQYKLLTRYANGGVFYQYLFTSCELDNISLGNQKNKTNSNNITNIKSANSTRVKKPDGNTGKANKPINESTKPNDWGNGSIFYLDRHDVNCGENRVLHGFHLIRPRPNQLAYEFSCLKVNNKHDNSIASKEKTKYDETANNDRSSTNYLDRHNIVCKPNHAIQEFKLIRDGRKIAYSYKCLAVKVSDCKSESTQESYGHNVFETIYLDRQRLIAGENRVLTQFKLNSRYEGNKVFYKYSYTSCRLDVQINNQNKKSNNNIKNSNLINGEISNQIKSNFSIKNNISKKIIGNLNVSVKFNGSSFFDKKIIETKGKNFCENYCVPNLAGKTKVCFDQGYKRCQSCIYKNEINIHNNVDSNELCTKACNALVGSNFCEFYAFFNNKKKMINANLLKKFGFNTNNLNSINPIQ